ncbi:MAG: branched-chain amino acid aminotransferase [Salibacteraceae bacterium]
MIDTQEIEIKRTEASRINEVDFKNLPFGKIFTDHMLVANYEQGKWRSVRIEPFGPLSLSPASSMMHYGQAIFEGMKAYKNQQNEVIIFRPEANLNRMNNSAERMCMPKIPHEIFINGLQQLLALDRDWIPEDENSSLYIRPFMIATDPYLGVKPSETYKFMIICSPVGPYYSKPLHLKIETKYTRAALGGIGFTKAAGNYGGALYPAMLAQQQGIDQLIWTDARDHQYLEEAGTMNVMLVIDDVLITPPLKSTILPGITRDSILTLARSEGIVVEERPISITEVLDAVQSGRLTELFGTGTAATIAQAVKLTYEDQTHELPPVENRPVSRKLGKMLNDIKKGLAPDTYGWNMKL